MEDRLNKKGGFHYAWIILVVTTLTLGVYGPGLTKQAHVVDEYIELDEYVDTIRIFKYTALKFLKM